MPTPFGQRLNPSWDALRVQTLRSVFNQFEGTPISGGVSGIDNAIYVWHGNGSTLDAFSLTEAGVSGAISVARDGDCIYQPACVITLTAGITIPAGVTWRGLSEYRSALLFDGITGIAVQLSTRSELLSCQIYVADSASGAVTAINAQAAKARVDSVLWRVPSSASHIGIHAGYAES